MTRQLVIGKYEFYPYEFDKNNTLMLEELLEGLETCKTKRVSRKRPAPRRKRRKKE